MEIVEGRYGKRFTIFSSQGTIKQWFDLIGEKTVVINRIVHIAAQLELKRESLRIIWNKIQTIAIENNFHLPENDILDFFYTFRLRCSIRSK